MRNNKFNLQADRKYTVVLAIVTLLNFVLIFFLLNTTFGKTVDNNVENQSLLAVRVMLQNNNPLRISVARVNNSIQDFQSIIYSVQNVTDKPVRAFTLLGMGKFTGKVISNSFAEKLLQPNEMFEGDIAIERKSIKEGEELVLSIDYVEFGDGNSWGGDTQGYSKHIAGERAGRNAVIKQLKSFVKNGESVALINLLNQDTTKITIPIPESNQTAEWQRGFQRGYKGVIFILKRNGGQNIELLSKKLDDLEKNAK